MEKRGQVSTFFILGVIIIALVSVGVFYRTEIVTKLSELQIVKGAALPPEAQKVHDFIIQCTKDTAKTGVELLGIQGGYIELPVDKVPQGNVNMFSNKLEVISGFRTAYWYYQKDNGISVEAIPSKASMSQYLKDYIDANIEECFDKFSTFPEYYKIDYRKVVSQVNIKNNEIQVSLTMPMVVDVKGQKFNFETFKTSVNVALGDLIDVATQIVENEMSSNFLEEKTEDMMVAYEAIPYSGSDLSCGVKTWALEKVITDFKTILFENIPQIRVAHTDYVLPNEAHKYFEWYVTKGKYPNINAFLSYSKRWPFYLDVTPREDGVLKAQQVTEKMGDVSFLAKSLFCMNDWNFVYDVKYPVLVTLYDKQNDYTFQFAMEVVIERNQPRKATIVPDFETDKNTKYCKLTKVATSTIYTYEEGLDRVARPLEGVDIKYKCITHLCDVGTTKLEGKDAMLSEEFPSCIGGTVVAEKEGYHKTKEIDVDSNEEFSLSMVLEKLIAKPVKIQVTRTGGGSSEPTKEEQVIIELEEPDKEYKTMILYPEQTEVKLIPGDYKVKAYVVRTGAPIRISGKEIQNCVDVPKGGLLGLLGSTEQQCNSVKLPDVELDSMVTGGTEFEWTVDKDELYTSDYIKFYITTQATPKSLEELSSVNLNQENAILPVFLNE
ncbi:MAG: hypothetical protein Q8O03_01585 [Nanoarchaeota archaeon]|nr:hypothetical protein [Nanoarchaeota archaeon]